LCNSIRKMTGISRQLMRIVLLALLFQFLSPAFFTVITQSSGGVVEDHHSVVLHAHHSSIVIPQLLKEKDETEEFKADVLDLVDFFPIIDFTDHSFVLAQLHESKFNPFTFSDHIDRHPPLFTLYRTFII
jgi:hypothetical protein